MLASSLNVLAETDGSAARRRQAAERTREDVEAWARCLVIVTARKIRVSRPQPRPAPGGPAT